MTPLLITICCQRRARSGPNHGPEWRVGVSACTLPRVRVQDGHWLTSWCIRLIDSRIRLQQSRHRVQAPPRRPVGRRHRGRSATGDMHLLLELELVSGSSKLHGDLTCVHRLFFPMHLCAGSRLRRGISAYGATARTPKCSLRATWM